MQDTFDRFWTNLMFVLFLLYPALSMASMWVFNCDTNIGRLREDYRVVCPRLSEGISIWSFVCIVLYPFGIPVFMHLSLRTAGIAAVVKEKVQQAEFAAMLSLFKKLSAEMHCFAGLVGNVQDYQDDFQPRQVYA